MLESLVAFGMLTFCVLLFFHQQSTLLAQSQQAQNQAAAARVLYEEVKAQPKAAAYQSYAIDRNQSYKVSIGPADFYQGEIEYDTGKITILRKK